MSPITSADAVLERFRTKCHSAGGPRTGFVLRRRAVLLVSERYPDLDLQQGIDSLISEDLLKSSESGDFLFLTETGAERLG